MSGYDPWMCYSPLTASRWTDVESVEEAANKVRSDGNCAWGHLHFIAREQAGRGRFFVDSSLMWVFIHRLDEDLMTPWFRGWASESANLEAFDQAFEIVDRGLRADLPYRHGKSPIPLIHIIKYRIRLMNSQHRSLA